MSRYTEKIRQRDKRSGKTIEKKIAFLETKLGRAMRHQKEATEELDELRIKGLYRNRMAITINRFGVFGRTKEDNA